MEGWLKARLTVSSEALFRVAFHQLSKRTLSVGQTSPEDLMVNELSGEKMEMRLPSPTSIDVVSVIANIVDQSDTMSTFIPIFSRSYVREYSISNDILPNVWSSRLPVAPSMCMLSISLKWPMA